jgi:hypothetical protein
MASASEVNKHMSRPRVPIPPGAHDLLHLAESVAKKHTDLGDASPLKGLDWAESGPIITDAVKFNNSAAQLHRDAEKATQSRDNLIGDVGEFVRQCRDVLLGVHRSNPRTLGDYGFEVNDTPPSKKNGNGNGDITPK